MAALDLEARTPERQPPMPGAVTTRRLEGALVAPRASKPVPNHIADTSKPLLAVCMSHMVQCTYMCVCVCVCVCVLCVVSELLFMRIFLQKSLAAPREMVFSRPSLVSSILMATRLAESINRLW